MQTPNEMFLFLMKANQEDTYQQRVMILVSN